MTNVMPAGYPGGYADYFQQVIKPVRDSLTLEEKTANVDSHTIGVVDDCRACIYCECKAWNTAYVRCSA